MKFNEVAAGRWESDVQAYVAVALNTKREPVGILAPRFIIEQKGSTFRVLEQHVGHKVILGRCRSFKKATELAEEATRIGFHSF